MTGEALHLLEHAQSFCALGTRPLMRRSLAFIGPLFLSAALFAATAQAAENTSVVADQEQVFVQGMDTTGSGRMLPVHFEGLTRVLRSEYLGTWFSKKHETKMEFLQRVAVQLRGYARDTGFEACGFIWHDEARQRFAIPLTGNHGHSQCVNTNMPPSVQGFTRTRETIHVHPEQGSYRTNAIDRMLDATARARPPHTLLYAPKTTDFSDDDYAAGPGYLITFGRFLHQDGKGTRTDLGPVPMPPEVPNNDKSNNNVNTIATSEPVYSADVALPGGDEKVLTRNRMRVR